MEGRHYCGTGGSLDDLRKSEGRYVGERVGTPPPKAQCSLLGERLATPVPDATQTRLSMERHVSGHQFIPSPGLVRLCTRPKHIDWLPRHPEGKVANYSSLLAQLNKKEKGQREPSE